MPVTALVGATHPIQRPEERQYVCDEGRGLQRQLAIGVLVAEHATIERRSARFLCNLQHTVAVFRERISGTLKSESLAICHLHVSDQHAELDMAVVHQKLLLPHLHIHLEPVHDHELAVVLARR